MEAADLTRRGEKIHSAQIIRSAASSSSSSSVKLIEFVSLAHGNNFEIPEREMLKAAGSRQLR
jgi:hypothetical protein